MTTADASPFPPGFVLNPSRFRDSVLAQAVPMKEDDDRLKGDGPQLQRMAYTHIAGQANGVNLWHKYMPHGRSIPDRKRRPVEFHVSDGVKRACDALGCYWLVDIVLSAIPNLPTLEDDHMAVVKLTRLTTTSRAAKTPDAVLKIDDGGAFNHVWYTQWIEYTDLPLHELKWYFTPGHDGIVRLMLPQER